MSSKLSSDLASRYYLTPSIFKPAESHIHEYPSVNLPVPDYKPVPGRSGVGTILEEIGQGLGIAGRGLLGVGEEIRDDSSDESDCDGVFSSDSSTPTSSKRNSTPLLTPKVAAGGVLMLGASGVALAAARQFEYQRQDALEHNQRTEKQTLCKAELRLAEVEAQRQNVQAFNRDHLQDKVENHRFVLEQLKLEAGLEATSLQVRRDAYVSTLEASVQLQKYRCQAIVESDRMREEGIVVERRERHEHEEKQQAIKAQLIENNQQLVSQAMESHKTLALDSNAKTAELFGRIDASQRAALDFGERAMLREHKLLEQSMGIVEKFLPSIDQAPDRFKPLYEKNQKLENLSVHSLLYDEFPEDVFNLIKSQIDAGIKEHLFYSAGVGAALSAESFLQGLLRNQATLQSNSSEFFDFIVRNLSKLPQENAIYVIAQLLKRYSSYSNILQKAIGNGRKK